jgi:hypothetical protein
MLSLHKRIEDDARATVHEPHAQLDVLDRGAGKAPLVEAADRQERIPTHGAEAGPKGGGRAWRALVHVVVEEVPELRDDSSGPGIAVV